MTARDRKFFTVVDRDENDDNQEISEKEKLLKYIRESVIGSKKLFSGPYGQRNGKSHVFATFVNVYIEWLSSQ